MRERASLNPLDVSQLGAGFFDGSLLAGPKGLVRGLVAEPARALNLALSAAPRAVDAVRGGTEATDWWMERMVSRRSGPGRLSEELAADPYTTGMAGQVMHSFFDIGGQALTMGPAGVGVMKGTAKATDLVDKGVDAGTALKVGIAQGATLALGVHLPMSLGLRSLGNSLYGAGASAVPSMADRLMSHEILAKAGYHEQAAQYKWLDWQQIAIDAVLGVALGGLGTYVEARQMKAHDADVKRAADTVRPADVDAALTANAARHMEIETAPGLPRDPAARSAHVAAVEKATEDLIAGRPVDVSGTGVLEAEFVPHPRRAELRGELSELLGPYEEIAARVREDAANDAQPVALRGEIGEARPALIEPEAQAGPTARPGTEPGADAGRVADMPESVQAQALTSRYPDMEILLEDGQTVRARDALARAEAEVAYRRNTARAFDAAVACFLRG